MLKYLEKMWTELWFCSFTIMALFLFSISTETYKYAKLFKTKVSISRHTYIDSNWISISYFLQFQRIQYTLSKDLWKPGPQTCIALIITKLSNDVYWFVERYWYYVLWGNDEKTIDIIFNLILSCKAEPIIFLFGIISF